MHDSDSFSLPEQDPPFFSSRVFDLDRVLMPLPQDFEQESQIDQVDQMQSTDTKD